MAKINTIYGELDEEQLSKVESKQNDFLVTEYYLAKELVHRSVAIQLAGTQATAIAKDLTRP